ncbi:PBECR4 domain-containing protein [Lachnospiraceae bacterium HCP1S3_A8]
MFFRDKVFQQILTGNISINDLKKSQYFPNIQNRIEPFIQIENFLDSNKLIFRYNQKLQTFSLIEAEYLLSTPYENTDIYIFLDRQKEPDYFFCRSFFQKEEKDYTKGQAIFTLLIKEKINLRTEEKIIQYDRLTPKSSF